MRFRTGTILLACCLAAGLTALGESSKSGLDVAGFDRTVLPQDDLYAHVNGAWLKRTVIPDDRVTYGTFAEIVDRTDRDLHAIIQEIAARPNRPRGSAAQQIADLYESTVNVERIEQLGASAMAPQLQRFDSIRSASDVAAEAGYLSSIGAGGPFAGTVGIDPLNPGAPVVRITQGGILLPDRDYYLKDDPALAAIRAKYVEYLRGIFERAGRAAPAEDARGVMAFESALAEAMWPEAESRNLSTTYTRLTLRQLAADMPGFDWMAWARPQGIDRSPTVIVAQPSFFKAFAALIPTVPVSTLRAWLLARYVTAAAPYLNRDFDDARYEFFGVVLTGQARPRERWKRGVSMVSNFLGDALGKLYVEKHFPPTTRARVQKILTNVLTAYRESLREADWLSPQARREALDKLSALSTGVGSPGRWRDYRSLTIKPDDLIGNWQRALTFDNQYRLGNLAGTAGGEWAMPPQTVNAYYSPGANEMVLPAALFQPPLFDPAADDAVNYGAVGSLIGHEIGHAFDDRGRRFDGAGTVRDWWTPADAERFELRARRLAAQLDRYEPLPGLRVNGALTVSESLGDLGGLVVAHRAYRLSLKGSPAPVIDGLSGEQRFFMGWAQMWRAKEREAYMRSTLQSVPYLPATLRANAAVSNVDAFVDTFNVKPGNRLYRPPADRVRIW